jgi:cytochrome c-type biogenesis protein CcmH/NrfG
MECGLSLEGLARAPRGGWQPTLTGGLVFGSFVVLGLGIWTSILTPDPPKPKPSGPVAAAAGVAAPAAPAKPIELPEEVKRAVGNLAARAEDRPEELDLWVHLGEVYYRTAQLDPAYYPKAIAAFDHVLAREPDRMEALRGKGNVHYDRKETTAAIELYERYLRQKPDDPTVQTDLATMYLFDGDGERAFATYRAVIAAHPDFLQAHYNLAAAYHQQGDAEAALAELQIARRLAKDDDLRSSIDDMIGRLQAETAVAAVGAAPASPRSPFQEAVEASLREHQILGPRITRIEWPEPGAARVLVGSFPMEHMPDAVRQTFEQRLTGYLTSAREAHPIEGAIHVTLVDAESGRELTSVSP